ncbi:MAG: hypothetical protein C4313_08910 [Thermoflexus sp.]|uniref:hypothetical protein n=1 Tax=Thermoflexus sp. TaxID=1969742 RepID=UPI0033194B11
MSLSPREWWSLIHGMGLGAVFLLAFAGGLAGLWSFRAELVTSEGIRERLRRLMAGTWIMAMVAWLTVLTGTYIVYPWYRAKPPQGADLTLYPRAYLLSRPETRLWHTFGMEWKEHIGWVAPILATAVAYLVARYGSQLAHEDRIRRAVIALFVLAFAAAGIAGLFGALITKAAPIR